MQISRKADYALRAVTILATLPPDKTMQAQELGELGKIPVKFLEQILLVLKRASILLSKRGVGGGYKLGKEARLISVADVIEAVDGDLVRFIDVSDYPAYPGGNGVRQFLMDAESAINSKLEDTSVEDLVRNDSGDALLGYGI